jgi:primosomal protein N' (replication factor Y)
VCGDEELVELGAGTQRLEAEIMERWPEAKVARLDRDVASRTGGSELLGAFARGEADILVGTQMVTKGHHFPRLTVVGVVSADDALHMPDFRAAERTFQTLVQVAGRAGRAEHPGTVYIQTRNPHHPVLTAAMGADYEEFARVELAERKSAGYPPYRRVALVRVSSESCAESEEAAKLLARWFAEAVRALSVQVLGPAPAPLEKLRGRFRHHLLLRAPANEPAPLRKLIAHFSENGPNAGRNVKLSIDVDPVNLL